MGSLVVVDAVGGDSAALDLLPVLRWSSKGGKDVFPKLRESVTQRRHFGNKSSAIPRVVWTYWQGTPLPLIVGACLSSWRKHLPAYRIHLLNPACLPTGMPPIPNGFASWSAHVQSDWVRLAVLAKFGGVWMDATTLLSSSLGANIPADGNPPVPTPLSFVEALSALDRPDLIGYFNLERTYDTTYPMLENWFLAAPAGSGFVKRWWQIFDAMLTPDGIADFDRVISGVAVSDLLQGFADTPHYFACHAAAQWVMREQGGRLSLLPAEIDAFWETHSRGWDPDRVCSWLCDAGIDETRPSARPLTKLISLIWRPLEERLQRGDVHCESILGELGVPSYA